MKFSRPDAQGFCHKVKMRVAPPAYPETLHFYFPGNTPFDGPNPRKIKLLNKDQENLSNSSAFLM